MATLVQSCLLWQSMARSFRNNLYKLHVVLIICLKVRAFCVEWVRFYPIQKKVWMRGEFTWIEVCDYIFFFLLEKITNTDITSVERNIRQCSGTAYDSLLPVWHVWVGVRGCSLKVHLHLSNFCRLTSFNLLNNFFRYSVDGDSMGIKWLLLVKYCCSTEIYDWPLVDLHQRSWKKLNDFSYVNA